MQSTHVWAAIGGCVLLAACATNETQPTDAATQEAAQPPVCQDAGGKPGAYCPCDPDTYKTVDCYSGKAGTSGVGVCKAGKRSCDPATHTLTECVGEVTPVTETCNLLDDDCNGVVDDVPEIADAGAIAHCTSPACDVGYADADIQCFAADPGICGAGTLACGAGGKVVCQPFIHAGAPEVCNGFDDDCNGAIDDGIGDLGSCEADAAGQCATSQYACDDGGLVCPPSQPSTESCDGVDNDCNGVVDDHACAGQKTAIYCCQNNSNVYGCTATPTDGNHKNCHAAL